MKKIVKFLAISSAAIAALVSCSKELEIQTPEVSADVRTVVFTAGIDTKTVFGEQSGTNLPTLWTETENINTVAVSLNLTTMKKSSEIEVSNGGASAKFEAAITDPGSGPYVFYAISPYPAVAAINSSYSSANLIIPASQTPSASSVDEAAQIVYAKYDAGSVFPESVSSLQFSHLTAYGRLAFSNLTLADGESIEKVTLTSPVNWVGKFYYYLEAHDPYGAGDWAEQATSSNILTINTSRTDNIWFACAPVDLGGQKVKVVITTDKATTYTKEITIPDGKKFESGKVNAFTINMNGISADAPSDEVWEETAIADLTSSDVFVIVGNNGSTFAMSNDKGVTAAPSAVAVTVSGNKLVGEIEDNIKWNISGNATDGYVFYPDGSTTTWLYTTTSNNGLRVGDSANKYVSIDAASGYMTIHDGATTRYIGIYNSADWRSYSSINNNIKEQTFKFYKKVGGGSTTTKTPLDAPTGVEALAGDDSILLTWNDILAPLNVTVTYKVTCTGQTDQVIEYNVKAAEFENLAEGLYDLSITAIPSDTENYSESTPVVVSNVRVGKVALATPVIKSFAQTKTGIVAELEAPIDNALKYDWTLREEGMADDAAFFSTSGVSLVSDFGDTEQIWNITSFTNGKEYTISVKALPDASSTEYKASEASATASFTAKDLDNVTYYTKVTSAPSDWGGTYLIVYEDGNLAFNGGADPLDAVGNSIEVTIDNGKIISDNSTAAAEFTIAAVTDGYSVQAKSGKYIGNGSDSNALTASDNPLVNTLSLDAENNANIISAGGAYLRYNSASNQLRFRYYKSTSYTGQKPIALYKLDGSTAPVDNRIDVTMSFDPAGPFEMNLGDQIDPDMTSLMLEPDTAPVEFTMVTVPDGIATIDSDSGEILTITGAGTITVTATMTDEVNYKPASASYVLVVKDNTPVNVGTAENPLTASQAIALAEANPSESFENAYVKGIVCQTGTINSSGQVNYYVSDDGSTTGKFEMFKGKYINGESFTADTNLGLGDVVVATGTLKYYSSGSQAELDADNQVVSVFRAPKFSPAGGIYTEAQTVTLSAESGATIYYTLDGNDPTTSSTVYSSALVISTTTTIKAIAVKSGVSSGVASATYTINAAANDGSLEHPLTPEEAKTRASSGDTGSYYIAGIVAKIQNQFSASYGTANFWLSVDGVAQDVFEGYKIKYLGNRSWVAGDKEIAVNDEVIIYGALTMYGSTAETSSGYIVSWNGKTKALTAGTLNATPNNANGAKDITVEWGAATGTNSAISYVVSCGSQTHNATAAGSHTFTMSAYGTYNVSVVASADDAFSATASTAVILSDPNSGSTDHYYVKVTSVDDVTDGDYLIVYESTPVAFNGGLSSFDATGNTISVSITDSGIKSTTAVDAAKFTISAMTGGYSIMGASGKYITVNSYSNGLATSASAAANGISFDSSGNVLITVATTGGTMTLKYNYASNQLRFRYYKSGQQSIQLYKLN